MYILYIHIYICYNTIIARRIDHSGFTCILPLCKVYTHIYVYTHTHTHTYIYIYVEIMYIYIYIYIYI